ncbi:putative WRKY transcription factor 14 [Apostasia shenzhenica]|uniref:Putative WRKY transcription factor 14 n=1 Tax=Apostasia shenzhenica TaxID=1088818 RepID=A0A2I0AJN3_9ASPA|nr:putative WRKY transcription factor 14 [Apostasia shenzhenica]
MCDYFWQTMEKSQGDLTDIFRACGLQSPPTTADFPANLTEGCWQIPPEPAAAYQPPNNSCFGDPFADFQDPLLQDLAGTNFFEVPPEVATAARGSTGLEKAVDGGGEEARKPCSSLFSRMLQISPGHIKASPVVRSPPRVASDDVKKAGAGSHDGGCLQIPSPRTSGIKKRKSQLKKVVCIPAPAAASSRPGTGEVVPSDLWAWRKYGQKPIKGSPHPRGYYRCSSSKGCSARKQVERSRTDPNMLVITYTSDHNHPWPTHQNALAGSTRSHSSKNPKQAANSLKEESKESSSSSFPAVKQEAREITAHELDQDDDFKKVFQQTFDHSDNFFTDFAEL